MGHSNGKPVGDVLSTNALERALNDYRQACLEAQGVVPGAGED